MDNGKPSYILSIVLIQSMRQGYKKAVASVFSWSFASGLWIKKLYCLSTTIRTVRFFIFQLHSYLNPRWASLFIINIYHSFSASHYISFLDTPLRIAHP